MAKKKLKSDTEERPVYSMSYKYIDRLFFLADIAAPGDTLQKNIIGMASAIANGAYMYTLPYPTLVHAMFDKFDIYIGYKNETFNKNSIFAPYVDDTEYTWRNRIRHLKHLSQYMNMFCDKRIGHVPLDSSIEYENALMYLWFLWADSNFRMNGKIDPDWEIPNHLLLKWSSGG